MFLSLKLHDGCTSQKCFVQFPGWYLNSLGSFIHNHWDCERQKPLWHRCIKGTDFVFLLCPSASWLTCNSFRLNSYWQQAYFDCFYAWVSEAWSFMIDLWQMFFINFMKMCDANGMAGGSLSRVCVICSEGWECCVAKCRGGWSLKELVVGPLVIKGLILVQMQHPTYKWHPLAPPCCHHYGF